MILTIALILSCGLIAGRIFYRLHLPQLVGFLLVGMILGPHLLNLIDDSILNISTEIRQLALVIILLRAGLNLQYADLRKVGRSAILLCFVPATFEILAMVLIAPRLLSISTLDAVILGAVVAAVSPAVIVPRMLNLIDKGWGVEQGIPQMIMAGASVDDVYVIVLFTAATGMAGGGPLDLSRLLVIPSSIILGIVGGILAGLALLATFKYLQFNTTVKVVITMATSLFLITIEHSIHSSIVGFSGLLAIMALGSIIRQRDFNLSSQIAHQYSQLWVVAEIFLFVLVGASVNIRYAWQAGSVAIVVVLAALCFRFVGTLVCVSGTKLNRRERLFTGLAYLPKATVQAAIGGLPLAMGLPAGEIILTVAVVSILLTAPVGAWLVDNTYRRCLQQSTKR